MTLPDGFLFGMDGLLLDSERMLLDLSVEMAVEIGLDRAEATAFFLDLIGTSHAESERRIRCILPNTVDFKDFEGVFWSCYDHLMAKGIPLRPFARDVVVTLRRLNLPMAVVMSSNGTKARIKLSKVGLTGYFDHVIGGDEVPATSQIPRPICRRRNCCVSTSGAASRLRIVIRGLYLPLPPAVALSRYLIFASSANRCQTWGKLLQKTCGTPRISLGCFPKVHAGGLTSAFEEIPHCNLRLARLM